MSFFRLCVALFLLLPVAQDHRPGRLRTTVERLDSQRLAAVHEARTAFALARKDLPRIGVYQDYRAVIHVHAEDSAHTRGTRQQVLEGAAKAGVRVVLSTDHNGPKSDSWRGVRQGVLFLAGSEEDGKLRFPDTASGDLQFLSHLEERPDASSAGFDGMEIYNRHTDTKDEGDFQKYFLQTHENPQEWTKLVEKLKAFPDEIFAAGTDYWPTLMERFDGETQRRRMTAVGANDAHQNQIFRDAVFDPYEVSFRNVSTHILARELSDAEIRSSLRAGHAYVSHDWLCDPTGFSFVAVNRLGVFEMGDPVPMTGTTQLAAQTPLPARLKLIHRGVVVQETDGARLTFAASQPGPYRVEAWLTVDGEQRPWIYSNPIYLEPISAGALALPSNELSPGIEVSADIPYTEGLPDDANKHKLDIYFKQGVQRAPVFFFIHGGAWRSGDRFLYRSLGNRFASEGIVTVAPSYRLSPKNPHPAQIDDVAAAFAWVVAHIQDYGGDPNRIVVGGHSAGGHLAALLTLAPKHLARYGLSQKNIRGAIALSGVYDVTTGLESTFGRDKDVQRDASPLMHVQAPAPPFLITYCQWDYLRLPQQAQEFHAVLQQKGVASELIYVAGESHISEIVRVTRPDDVTARAILRFIRQHIATSAGGFS